VKPEQLLYAKTHEWVHLEAGDEGSKVAQVGISAFAIEALTDLVYVDLPEVGSQVTAGEPFGEIESVKAVSDLYSPVDGEVIAVNQSLADALERLSENPYDDGWLIRVRLKDEAALADLMDLAAYEKQCAEEEH
jgi:glycine cleavage system H protein